MEELQSRWHRPFWVDVRAQVLGTVIGGAILAFAGFGISLLTGLSVGEAALYVVPPVGTVLVLAALGVAALRLRRALRSGRIVGDSVLRRVNDRAMALHELQLRDVIHEARVGGWTVERGAEELVFRSPDDEDVVHVSQDVTSQYKAADLLHNTSPHHFPDRWQPSHIRALIDTEIQVGDLVKRLDAVGQLADRVEELETKLPIAQGRAALADVAAEAVTLGWEVVWGDATARFEKGHQTATVPYTEINLVKLRKILLEN